MSWLFTLVFSGLIFSSNPGKSLDIPAAGLKEVPQVIARVGDETEKVEQTYPLSENGRVSVSNVNGSIRVEAWDRNEVKFEYTKIADTRERLADVDIRVESNANNFNVETDYNNSRDQWKNGAKLIVEFRLMVPKGAILNEIETVNGSVEVSNFTNITKISAVNGTVKATNLRGTADLSTVNGEVVADFDRLDGGSKITLSTVNGRVNLLLPSDANATLRADSLNGSITNDFGLPVRKGKYVGRDLYGKVGSGEVQIKLDSVNGGLSIGKKGDGKNQNPVIDLLPQKEKDDEKWESDSDGESSSTRSARMDRDIAKAAKDGAKFSAKANEMARLEIERIKPEIERMTADATKVAAEVVNSKDIQRSIEDSLAIQKNVLATMADANFVMPVPRIEKKSNAFPVKGVPKVSVEANGCAIKIVGWDRPEVKYSVTQISNSRNQAPIDVKEKTGESSVELKVISKGSMVNEGNFFDDNNRARIEIYVPRRSNLKITTNGEIRIEGVSGDVDLTGGNEAVNVRDVEGSLRVTTADGRIRVIGFRGDLDARTADGALSLEGDFKSLSANAADGPVTLTLASNTDADIETQESEIRFDGIQSERKNSNPEVRDGTISYRIGKGGNKFKIVTAGEILVRGQSSLTAGF